MYACLVLLNNIVVSLIISSAFLVALSIAAVLAACSLVTDSRISLDTVRFKNLGKTVSINKFGSGSIKISDPTASLPSLVYSRLIGNTLVIVGTWVIALTNLL